MIATHYVRLRARVEEGRGGGKGREQRAERSEWFCHESSQRLSLQLIKLF